ncbi:hypothetical protein TRM7557_01837 [Tritonibacter multivorans]|uniref:Uncharacterized protein n=1 Tax=Tritonibacter multivorans TaxID=928856 RepID=A0A0P1GA12_9RHOB|nr:hypothetical protein TRM7557_01837 [Tritonibacter multivorans]SFD15666.1 hypothetical protein SAMN04488049_1089 [Tritonibacter multivorans]
MRGEMQAETFFVFFCIFRDGKIPAVRGTHIEHDDVIQGLRHS